MLRLDGLDTLAGRGSGNDVEFIVQRELVF